VNTYYICVHGQYFFLFAHDVTENRPKLTKLLKLRHIWRPIWYFLLCNDTWVPARPVYTGAFFAPVYTGRIYGPFIRPIYTGSVYRPLGTNLPCNLVIIVWMFKFLCTMCMHFSYLKDNFVALRDIGWYMLSSCVPLSVTSHYFTEMTKYRIMQTMPHNSAETSLDARDLGDIWMGSPLIGAPNRLKLVTEK